MPKVVLYHNYLMQHQCLSAVIKYMTTVPYCSPVTTIDKTPTEKGSVFRKSRFVGCSIISINQLIPG